MDRRTRRPLAAAQTGPLRIGTILKIGQEVCRGMDYLHKRKIVHRDLKVCGVGRRSAVMSNDESG